METETTEYGLVNVDELVRAKDHEQAFPYTDTNDCEGTTDSYKKLKRIFPVVYVILNIGGRDVKAVIDGWRWVVLARAAGIKEVYACKLNLSDDDERRAIMIQLARTNHQTYLALYYMILAVWDKHLLGQGYRSDKDVDLDKPVLAPDGKRVTIYNRVGAQLGIKPHKVKYIKKIGDVNPRQFKVMDTERPSLYKVFCECVQQSRGDLPQTPAVKAPVYHTSTTGAPAFTPPTSTGAADTTVAYDQPKDGTGKGPANTATPETAVEIPVGTLIDVDDEYITITVICQCCQRETLLKIHKTDIA